MTKHERLRLSQWLTPCLGLGLCGLGLHAAKLTREPILGARDAARKGHARLSISFCQASRTLASILRDSDACCQTHMSGLHRSLEEAPPGARTKVGFCVYVYRYTHTHVPHIYLSIYLSIYIYIYTYLIMYQCVCICMYVYIYIQM